jgi:3-hydroxyacyl-CoA dehydrogenase
MKIDALTGPIIGRLRATFRTADVVGRHTLVKVGREWLEHCPDEARSLFTIPEWLTKKNSS